MNDATHEAIPVRVQAWKVTSEGNKPAWIDKGVEDGHIKREYDGCYYIRCQFGMFATQGMYITRDENDKFCAYTEEKFMEKFRPLYVKAA